MRQYRIQTDAGWHDIAPVGRDEWALLQLIAAGPQGCTPIANPAPRWAHYVFKLRRMGLDIQTIHEPHSGRFPGHHARYVLHSWVEPVEVRDVA